MIWGFKGRITPLKYNEVIYALSSLGYICSKKTSTSHEKWIAYYNNKKYVVTVDKHEAPFSIFLVCSMAKQCGLDKHSFHGLCKGRLTADECLSLIIS